MKYVSRQELLTLAQTIEIKLSTEVTQVKRLAAQLLKTHEKLQTTLLKEHGLTRRMESEEKERSVSIEGEEKDITLMFAESSIHQIDMQRKTDLTAAVKAMESMLDNYLKKAAERVSLATLARRIKGWYEKTPEIVYPLENLLSPPDPATSGIMTMSGSQSVTESTPISVTIPLSSGSASTSSTTSHMTGTVVQRPVSNSLSQTLIGGEAKKISHRQVVRADLKITVTQKC